MVLYTLKVCRLLTNAINRANDTAGIKGDKNALENVSKLPEFLQIFGRLVGEYTSAMTMSTSSQPKARTRRIRTKLLKATASIEKLIMTMATV